MVLLIPLIVVLVIVAASLMATDSRDGRDWSAPMIGSRNTGRPDQQCCA